MRFYCLGKKKKKSATFSVSSVAFGGKISVYHALRRVIFFPTRLHACHGCLNSLATMSHSKFGGTRFK